MWQRSFDTAFVLSPKHAAVFRETAANLSEIVGWEEWLARGPDDAERGGVKSTPNPAKQANSAQCLLDLLPGKSHLYRSGPRLKGAKSDWLVNAPRRSLIRSGTRREVSKSPLPGRARPLGFPRSAHRLDLPPRRRAPVWAVAAG